LFLFKEHFQEDQFENHRADNKRKLKPNAIPTLRTSVQKVLQEKPANTSEVKRQRLTRKNIKSVYGEHNDSDNKMTVCLK
jgi:hypothetical protein